jgi:hypothetical protein
VDIRIKPGQPLAYLRRAPMWLVLLAAAPPSRGPDEMIPRAGSSSMRNGSAFALNVTQTAYIREWRATADEDGHYCFAGAL